ncbi:unnamed protein product [Arctogadus glacialis]
MSALIRNIQSDPHSLMATGGHLSAPEPHAAAEELQGLAAPQGLPARARHALKTTHAPPGDTLVHGGGDVLTALYFISRGSIEILRERSGGGPYWPVRASGEVECGRARPDYCDPTRSEGRLLEVLDMYPDFSDISGGTWRSPSTGERHSLRRRNRPDGMDRDDACPDQANHRGNAAVSAWDELGSSGSLYSASSDEEDFLPSSGLGPALDHSGPPYSAPPMEVGGLCGYWNERRASQLSDRAAYHPPPRPAPRPGLLESRLELLQSQLNRLEGRMTADITIILQLLQRQMAPIPPAYSTVPPGPHPAAPPHPPPALLAPGPAPLRTALSIPPVLVEGASTPLQSPDPQPQSEETLSSGVHLTPGSDDTMSLSPDGDPRPRPSVLGLRFSLAPPGRLSGGPRFPSLPELLETPAEGQEEVQRHLSDPSLPAS